MKRNKIGKYELLGSLGRGGFGNVYKAKTDDGALFAIKVLNHYLKDYPEIVQSFFHEANILSTLNHTNICKLVDYFPDGPDYAIVLEYIDGVNLKEFMHMQPDNLIPFDQAIKIARECISAFQYAYEKGIIHRDIKPSNIMINHKGKSIITDFGIAVFISDKAEYEANGMISAAYSAPERFGEETGAGDIRSDIYSLGIVFYEIFTGRLPFNLNSRPEIKKWHQRGIALPADAHNPTLAASITAAIKTAIEKKSEKRFKDFLAFKCAMGI